jgi:hypothetical protein
VTFENPASNPEPVETSNYASITFTLRDAPAQTADLPLIEGGQIPSGVSSSKGQFSSSDAFSYGIPFGGMFAVTDAAGFAAAGGGSVEMPVSGFTTQPSAVFIPPNQQPFFIDGVTVSTTVTGTLAYWYNPTPVPEPAVITSLLGIGLLGFGMVLLRSKIAAKN